MPTLMCLGLGYCAQHYVAEFGQRFDRIVGTTRSAEDVATLAARRFGSRAVEMHMFDGKTAGNDVRDAIAAADALLISAPPADGADPVLAVLGNDILRAPALRSIAFLSTLGVYPNSNGAWIDESTEVDPRLARRGSARREAEITWQALGARRTVPVAILRLGGIYGPRQNVMIRLLRGDAHRIAKPGHVSNRVHVFDVVQAIDAAFARHAEGIFNVVDDEPTSPSEHIAFAAKLLGIAPPPEIPFAEAHKVMTSFALSFYEGCIRARNDKLKKVLGVRLRYPTYREGLQALHHAGDHLAVGTNLSTPPTSS
jgi:nucleoside-diphosphate-sugar epimerase